ncbi:MAG: sel1 repeat family protein [Xanthomonadaceae bacterium]|nr:sel1 repeat family protein [Xanthomonadaceae bacterium]
MTAYRLGRNLLWSGVAAIGLCMAAFCQPAFAGSASGAPQAASGTSSGASSSTDTAPSYSSDPTFGARSFEDFNSPEADARPGEYYFQLAVRAFEKKQYRHAIDMYQVAASWAYKPAEYNLGVMYFRGQGVPADRPLGTAWMVLAAERNDPHYAQARDLMVRALSNAEFAKADTLFGQLVPTYGDKVALHRAKVRWAQVRAGMTGSHVGGTVGMLRVGAMGESGGVAASPLDTPAASLRHVDTSGFELLGGHDMDGSVAYQQFRRSDNPYDVKFENSPIGTTSVGPLTPVEKKRDKAASTPLDDTAHNP